MPALLSLANCWRATRLVAEHVRSDLTAAARPSRLHRLQRRGQRRRIGAAGLRHVGPAAALAADLLRDVVDELARLHLRREVAGDAGDQRHLAVGDRGQHDRRALELVLQLVHRLAQRLRVGAVERRGEHLRALHVDRAAGEVVARADAAAFALSARAPSRPRARSRMQLRDARLDLGDRRLERRRRAR